MLVEFFSILVSLTLISLFWDYLLEFLLVQISTVVIILAFESNRIKLIKILKVKQRAFYDRLETTFKFAKVIKKGIETNIRTNYQKTQVLFLAKKDRYAYLKFMVEGKEQNIFLPYDKNLLGIMKERELYLNHLVKGKNKKILIKHPPGIPYFYTAKMLNGLSLEVKNIRTGRSRKFKGSNIPEIEWDDLKE